MGKGDDVEDDFLLMFCYSHKQCDDKFCDRAVGMGWRIDDKGMCLSRV